MEMVLPLLAERIRTNVAHFAAGEALIGLVDPAAGYEERPGRWTFHEGGQEGLLRRRLESPNQGTVGRLDSGAVDRLRPLDLDAREIGILTPALEVADVVEQASGVGEIANRPGVDRLLLTVVEAGRAALEIAGAPRTDGEEHGEPFLLRSLFRLNPDDSLLVAGLDDARDMSSRLGEQVREVRAEPTLDEADEKHVGESAGQHPVQCVSAFGPPLRKRQAADPLGVKAEPLVQIRRDFESGGVDQQVHRVLDTIDDRPRGGDLVDTASFCIDEVDVGPVEGCEIVVMKADAFAVFAPIRLESLGRLGIVDDRLDSLSDGLHHLEIDALECLGFLLRPGTPLRVDPHDICPSVIHHVHFGLGTGDRLREIDDPVVLPSGLEALKPLDVGGLLVANAHRARCALKDEDFLGSPGQLRHDLHSGSSGADDADTLVGQLIHRFVWSSAGVVVVPPTGVEGLALESIDPGYPGKLGFVQDSSCQHEKAGREPVATAGRHLPAQRILAPRSTGDVGLEERSRVQVERTSQQPAVLEDLRRAGVALGWHIARLFEKRQVDVGLDVAHAAWVAIPVPGATEVPGLFDDPEIGDPVLEEVDRREHPGEASPHHQDGRLLDQRVPGEAGVGKRVLVEFLSQLTPLGHAVDADALLLLLSIALPQLVDCGAFCAVVLLCHSRSSFSAVPADSAGHDKLCGLPDLAVMAE